MNLDNLEQSIQTCDKEAINTIGYIQPIGFLALFDNQYRMIELVGDNAIKLQPIIQKTIIELEYHINTLDENEPLYHQIFINESDYTFRIFKSGEFIYCEGNENFTPYFNDFQIIDNIYKIFEYSLDDKYIYEELSDYIKHITGYDKVMVYKFDHEYNGEVIAEAKNSSLGSYLFHHFPASDIPVQARELYLKNKVRFISNVDDIPLKLPQNIQNLDMTYCSLRAVSNMHIQYLINMGVRASMSLSIIVNGKLWGLIACHHMTPKKVSISHIKTLTLLSSVISREIMQREYNTYIQNQYEIESKIETLIDDLDGLSLLQLDSEHLSKYLFILAKIYQSDYCILFVDNKYISSSYILNDRIVDRLDNIIGDNVEFITNSLVDYDSWFDTIRELASGLFFKRFGTNNENKLYFLRKEIPCTIIWAGKPAKEFTNGLLSPRQSFNAWEEIVCGKSMMFDDSLKDCINILTEKHFKKLLHNSILSSDPFEIISQIKDSVILTSNNDKDNQILFVNEAFCNLYGYSENEVIGKNPRFLHAEDREQDNLTLIRNHLVEQKPISTILKNYTKNGQLIYIDLSISPIYEKDTQEVKYYLGIQKNITNEKKVLNTILKLF